jgi:eukaryotic-like serine/threonine-protein kinase
MNSPEPIDAMTSDPRGPAGDDLRHGRRPSPTPEAGGSRSSMANLVDSFLRGSGLDPGLAEIADEITEQLQRGEEVDLDACDVRYPEWAATIRSLMPVLREMAELGRTVRSEVAAGTEAGGGPSSAGGTRVLGDFRVLREVGRGGMGIVYEAEQLSLARRVALKVLPLAAAMDPRALQRFQLEAQAAAWLQHPQIVPVYAIGSLGDVPYYAMQFIEGASLAELINELRRLEGLEATDLLTSSRSGGICALARGLLAGRFLPPPAESDGNRVAGNGILTVLTTEQPPAGRTAVNQSDVSPPKALPGAVARGRDFARTVAHLGVQAAEALEYAHGQAVLHRDIKPANLMLDRRGVLWVTDFGLVRLPGEGGLTLTGDVVGTLRYMSPEQALGRRALIDRRTDIYSLGATLYELLTLTPAVPGRDRQELLRGMLEAEPTPVRRLNPAVPVDLANVITKAISKEPSGRYETAQHFADDLRRFLDGRAIAARPSGPASKVWRWCHRRPLPAGLILGLVLTLLSGLVAVTWSWRDALHQRDLMAHAQRQTEDALRRESLANQALQKANGQERAAREQAQRRFDLATKAVEQYYTGASEEVLLKQPQMASLRKRLLETALSFYKELQASIEEGPDDLKSRTELAKVYERVGRIAVDVGSRQEGLEAFERASAILDEVIRAVPTSPGPRHDQAACLDFIGKLLAYTSGREEDGIRALERALALSEGLSAERPDDADRLLDVAAVAGDLAYERARMGRIEEGLDALQRKCAILEKLAAQHPSMNSYRNRLGITFGELGKIQATAGHLSDSLRSHHQAAALFERLAFEEPSEFVHRRRRGQVELDIGRTLSDAGRPGEALSNLERGLAVLVSVAADVPAVDSYQRAIAEANDLLGAVLNRMGRRDDALQALTHARAVLTGLARNRPEFVAYQADLAENNLWTGAVHQDSGRFDEARHELREARDRFARMAPVGELVYALARAEARLVPLAEPALSRSQAGRAMSALRQAVARGYHSLDALRTDPCLDPIRDLPEFELLMLDLQFPVSPFSA